MKCSRMLATAAAIGLIAATAAVGAASKKTVTGVVNINTASMAELVLLPGVGPAKAQAIIDYRKDRPFEKTQDLKEVKGFGDKLFASLEQYITVSGQSTAAGGPVLKPAVTQQPTSASSGGAGKAF